MPWPPPNFAYLLTCQLLACLSSCASTLKRQQRVKTYVAVSKDSYFSLHPSDPDKKICNGKYDLNLLESFSGQRPEGGLDSARSKDDKRSYFAYLYVHANLGVTFQSPPATPTLLDKTYKRAASGAVLALRVSIFLYRCRSSSSDYFRKNH